MAQPGKKKKSARQIKRICFAVSPCSVVLVLFLCIPILSRLYMSSFLSPYICRLLSRSLARARSPPHSFCLYRCHSLYIFFSSTSLSIHVYVVLSVIAVPLYQHKKYICFYSPSPCVCMHTYACAYECEYVIRVYSIRIRMRICHPCM